MKKILLGAFIFAGFSANAQIDIKKIGNTVINTVTGNGGTGSTLGQGLSSADIVSGLKEALKVSSSNSSESASKIDGFYKNPLIKIPFPKEAKIVETTVRQLGMNKPVDRFVMSLNRAAEEASKQAAPIFLNAITSLTINDGLSILNGGKNAATEYLKSKTTAELKTAFAPIVKTALDKVEVTKYWKPIVTKYNKVPLVQKQNPNLDQYVTDKALEGLFTLVSQEEEKIRTNPTARVNDILKKVFGN